MNTLSSFNAALLRNGATIIEQIKTASTVGQAGYDTGLPVGQAAGTVANAANAAGSGLNSAGQSVGRFGRFLGAAGSGVLGAVGHGLSSLGKGWWNVASYVPKTVGQWGKDFGTGVQKGLAGGYDSTQSKPPQTPAASPTPSVPQTPAKPDPFPGQTPEQVLAEARKGNAAANQFLQQQPAMATQHAQPQPAAPPSVAGQPAPARPGLPLRS